MCFTLPLTVRFTLTMRLCVSLSLCLSPCVSHSNRVKPSLCWLYVSATEQSRAAELFNKLSNGSSSLLKASLTVVHAGDTRAMFSDLGGSFTREDLMMFLAKMKRLSGVFLAVCVSLMVFCVSLSLCFFTQSHTSHTLLITCDENQRNSRSRFLMHIL